jgi:RNA polymerase-binding transcription factor DksA
MNRRDKATTIGVFIRMLFLACLVALVIADTKKQSGMKPEEIMEAETRLADLGYWTGPIDGKFDGATRHALIAFQKIEGRKRTGELTADELIALRSARRHEPREKGFAHVEIDLHLQVAFIVDAAGVVSGILPISSGSGELFASEGWARRAVTPTGRFTIQRKIAGWRKSPLGLLYYPNYITGGVAIHGNPLVPARPQSHGCIRIPMFAAKEFSEMVPIGTVVLVYDEHSTIRPQAANNSANPASFTPDARDHSPKNSRSRQAQALLRVSNEEVIMRTASQNGRKKKVAAKPRRSVKEKIAAEQREIRAEIEVSFQEGEELAEGWQERDSAAERELREVEFYNRELLLDRLRQISDALERLEEGKYGLCVECGRKIGTRRLKYDPAAALCLRCQQAAESAQTR